MSESDVSAPRQPTTFALGQVVATPAALTILERLGIDPWQLLRRHLQRDWGDLCVEDWHCNESALVSGARLFSSYVITSAHPNASGVESERLWVITEACDEVGMRRSTCLLTPGDY